jgi:hypothetical protein
MTLTVSKGLFPSFEPLYRRKAGGGTRRPSELEGPRDRPNNL